MKISRIDFAALFVLFPLSFSYGAPPATEDVSEADADASGMVGTYVGDFGGNKITVGIDRVIGTSVSGYSIVSGNERAFSGAITRKADGFEVTAKEPGDHPDDGVFRFAYVSGGGSKLIRGTWVPNNKKIGERAFELAAREFEYDPKLGDYPQSSTKLLAAADVENLRPAELRIMRNEIYARHGYSFKLADMRKHFDGLDWYMPVATNVALRLTETETKNAALIKTYEEYGAEYYDSFGR